MAQFGGVLLVQGAMENVKRDSGPSPCLSGDWKDESDKQGVKWAPEEGEFQGERPIHL